jgi:uncharacterized protein YkwD
MSSAASRPLLLGAVNEVSRPWATSPNRQKVLGFAAMAVSLVLVGAPFVLNVDSDVVAKAQTVSVGSLTNSASVANTVTTEMAVADDVIAALNLARIGANASAVERDEQLELGAQGWASVLGENGNIRTDRSLRALLSDRSAVGEFVVAAPSLGSAYGRVMANPSQRAQLTEGVFRNVGVGVQTSGNKTYLVIRFAP